MKLIKCFIIFLCAILCGTNLPAQKLKWASKLVSYSSEYKDPLLGKDFRAIHVLGKPNKYPQFAYSAAAWRSLLEDNPEGEYIIVDFDTLMPIKQVAIFENFGAGSITRVDALDENNNLILLKEFSPNYQLAPAQVTSIQLPNLTSYKVRGIKISMNSERVKGVSQIDAIGISDTSIPIIESLKLATEPNASVFRENLGKNINTVYIEICPVISPDGKKIYFTRENDPNNIGKTKNQDIWFSTLNDDKTWSKALIFPEPINNTFDNAICGISLNGKSILLNNIYGIDGQMEKGVSMSYLLRTGDWSFPKALKIRNFKNKSKYSEYTLAPNGKILLMTTEMKDSYGEKDIYVSFWKNDDTWTEPLNIGPVVNSGESESTPFIAPDGVTMYFSSSGHSGYGKNDIFLTRRLDDSWTKWTEPENLGPIVNTPEWDGYFSVSAQGDYAYFSSVENSIGAEDIFRIKIPEKAKPLTLVQLSGSVQNLDTKESLTSQILVKSLNSSDSLLLDYDPYLGDFSFMWPAKKPFSIQAIKKGYFSKMEKIDFSAETKFKSYKRNLTLIEIQLNKQYQFSNIIFTQSQSDLLPDSYPELDKIVSLLKENPSFRILLEGHTDNQGDWSENLKLSNDRVETVKNYLITKGILSSRIQTKGWGGTKPVSSNLTEERRKLNRRVEFTLFSE
jgi:outer membrane protein OmpA-like peptidoglycan-associated protein